MKKNINYRNRNSKEKIISLTTNIYAFENKNKNKKYIKFTWYIKIQNIEIRYLIIKRWNRFLLKFHFSSCVHKNLYKHLQSSYRSLS